MSSMVLPKALCLTLVPESPNPGLTVQKDRGLSGGRVPDPSQPLGAEGAGLWECEQPVLVLIQILSP